MDSWIGLLKKDFLLMKNRLLVFLLIDLAAFALGWYLHIREIGFVQQPELNWVLYDNNDLIKFIPLVIAIGIHVLFIGNYILMSLNKEGKQLHLWLHNPQSAIVLLGSKLVNGFIALILSLGLLIILTTINLIPFLSEVSFYLGDLTKLLLYFVVNIIFLSLLIGICFMFFWTIYHVLKSRIGRWSVLVLIILINLFIWMFVSLESTAVYNQLVQWGEYKLEFSTLESFNYSDGEFDQMITNYLGKNLFDTIFALLLFVISAWVIEKKVEV
ncbi:hypothetical protein [Chengkuizengella marina]|uniref:ABC-2 type transport system permease protein n=1 Tax=Chengkuizengella marina TaxID=2507566 RepID=A0A6N9Q8E2_9BACL|nr:hypothetical protein [Chengkuizengella marina]NBI30884.1 hypothetical protein [Chengkuizengella marina]